MQLNTCNKTGIKTREIKERNQTLRFGCFVSTRGIWIYWMRIWIAFDAQIRVLISFLNFGSTMETFGKKQILIYLGMAEKKGTNNLCTCIRWDTDAQIHKKVFYKHLLEIKQENPLQQIQFPQNTNCFCNETWRDQTTLFVQPTHFTYFRNFYTVYILLSHLSCTQS